MYRHRHKAWLNEEEADDKVGGSGWQTDCVDAAHMCTYVCMHMKHMERMCVVCICTYIHMYDLLRT